MSLDNLPLEIIFDIAKYSHKTWYRLALTIKNFGIFTLDKNVQIEAKSLFSIQKPIKPMDIPMYIPTQLIYDNLISADVNMLPNGDKHGSGSVYYKTEKLAEFLYLNNNFKCHFYHYQPLLKAVLSVR